MKLLENVIAVMLLAVSAESFLAAHHRSIRAKASVIQMTTARNTESITTAWYPSRSSRAGMNLPNNAAVVDKFIAFLRKRIRTSAVGDYIGPIKDLQSVVEQDPNLLAQFTMAFATSRQLKEGQTSLDTPAVKNFEEFLAMLDVIMSTAPVYNLDCNKLGNDYSNEPAGLIAFPINAILAWPMATNAGQGMFANTLVNDCFLRVLNHWQENFLTTDGSRYVLPPNAAANKNMPSNSVGWLHEGAKAQMVKVAFDFVGDNTDVVVNDDGVFVCKPKELERDDVAPLRPTFEQVFDLPDPDDLEYYGFNSWDEFFLRKFSNMGNGMGVGPRPLNGLGGYQPWPLCDDNDDSMIVNACESAPLNLVRDVKADSKFWLKGQEYSLNNMLNHDELAHKFVGGCVYQAYLSALSYHRWNAPVSGTVVKVVKIPGTYYLENIHTGFEAQFIPDDKETFTTGSPDTVGPNDSQKFLTAVATRMAIYIQAKDPNIGLMCFLAIGMAEVSSTEADVKAGDVIKKGDQIGKFHYGGSTHCLIFRKEAADNLTFYTELPNGENNIYNTSPSIDAKNIPVLAQIAKCTAKQ